MNPQKALIIEGERHRKEKSELLDAIDKASSLEAKIDVLLLITGSTIREQVATIDQRLVKLNKEFLISFERESAEANEKMPTAIMLGQSYIGKEPLAISEKIGALIEEYKGGVDQERKNDLFFELFDHINFFKNKVK